MLMLRNIKTITLRQYSQCENINSTDTSKIFSGIFSGIIKHENKTNKWTTKKISLEENVDLFLLCSLYGH
jgi:hypothetical protein